MEMGNDDSNKNTPDISNVVEKILGDIQNLQQMETELFNKIEKDASLTPQQQSEIIDQINKLSTMRSNLYSTLSEINNFYQNAMGSSTGTLQQQTAAINIVETELNRSKERLKALKMDRNNKIRLVEINSYYGAKYAEHSSLMRIIIFTLIPIIILTIIYNTGFLPSRIYYIIFIIIGFIGAWYFWQTYASIITRDNMNYDSYNWNFNPNGAPKSTSSDTSDPWASIGVGTCVGEYCCSDGQTYDNKLNKCVGASTISESFEINKTSEEDKIMAALTKTQQGKYKEDFNLSDLKPYNSLHS
jgi:hypothetical protein